MHGIDVVGWIGEKRLGVERKFGHSHKPCITSVHVSFIMDLAIYIPFNGHWKESLRISISDVTRMSARPLKWLRFLCYIILNSTGHVYRDMYAADIHEPGTEEDYDAPVTSSEYYYLPGWLFFVLVWKFGDAQRKSDEDDDDYNAADVAGIKTQGCTSAKLATNSRPDYVAFVDAVNDRDGGRCRFTNVPSHYLQRAHIIPYSKGFEVGIYILIRYLTANI
jgi:hypothetical protein